MSEQLLKKIGTYWTGRQPAIRKSIRKSWPARSVRTGWNILKYRYRKYGKTGKNKAYIFWMWEPARDFLRLYWRKPDIR